MLSVDWETKSGMHQVDFQRPKMGNKFGYNSHTTTASAVKEKIHTFGQHVHNAFHSSVAGHAA